MTSGPVAYGGSWKHQTKRGLWSLIYQQNDKQFGFVKGRHQLKQKVDCLMSCVTGNTWELIWKLPFYHKVSQRNIHLTDNFNQTALIVGMCRRLMLHILFNLYVCRRLLNTSVTAMTRTKWRQLCTGSNMRCAVTHRTDNATMTYYCYYR